MQRTTIQFIINNGFYNVKRQNNIDLIPLSTTNCYMENKSPSDKQTLFIMEKRNTHLRAVSMRKLEERRKAGVVAFYIFAHSSFFSVNK